MGKKSITAKTIGGAALAFATSCSGPMEQSSDIRTVLIRDFTIPTAPYQEAVADFTAPEADSPEITNTIIATCTSYTGDIDTYEVDTVKHGIPTNEAVTKATNAICEEVCEDQNVTNVNTCINACHDENLVRNLDSENNVVYLQDNGVTKATYPPEQCELKSTLGTVFSATCGKGDDQTTRDIVRADRNGGIYSDTQLLCIHRTCDFASTQPMNNG